MPFFSVFLPPKLRSHPAFKNLKNNMNRLTTPFDIYPTLWDILNFNKIKEEDFDVSPTRSLKRSLSLFRPIPNDRTCKEAEIEPHWCTCVSWKSMMGDEKLEILGKSIVSEIVKAFNGFLEEEKHLCAELELSKIEKMERLIPDEGVLKYDGVKDIDGFQPKFNSSKIIKDFVTYRFSFWTEPGSANYETTVQFNEATKKLKVDAQAISHKAMAKRLPVEKFMNPNILGEEIVFPTSKRIAKNRFLKSALSEYVAHYTPNNPATHGLATNTHVNMYEKWSAGGYGVVITGNIITDQLHLESPGNTILQKELDSPERKSIWSEIASRAKAQGNLILAQLGNAGRQTPTFVNPRPFSSSTVALSKSVFRVKDFGEPVELTTEQVRNEVIDKFTYAAKYLYEAGFDGIQLHGAHGYMIAQFLSKTTNKRTDKYGGSPRNRAQIVVDIYNAIREQVPASTGFIVGIKLNSVEFQNEGLTTDEAEEVARTLDEAGLDFIELSGGTYEEFGFVHKESTKKREAYFAEFAGQIKPVVKNAIVYVTGGFRTVPAMVQSIKDGVTDGIGLGRPATGEFDFPKRILNRTVQSAKKHPFEGDLISAILACSLQMAQAGSKPLKDSKDVNDGIMDLTDEKTVEEYNNAQKLFLLEILGAGKEGNIKYGVVPYKVSGFVGNIYDTRKSEHSNGQIGG
ncbi:hypothetical protein FO519_009295 [Halicephalobus sp. NKZ332]|nr:hypothetical protein FO519_009295 [Halicephalobus sp. NKZ332]